MKEIQVTTTITVKEDGEILAETKQAACAPDNESNAAAVLQQESVEEITEEKAERYAVASDLAEVCDYLTDSEVIKIRLIISKARERVPREGKA